MAERNATKPSTGGGTSRAHLRPAELVRAIIMHDSGMSARKIGDALGRHHSTISNALAGLQDTRDVAKRVLQAGSVTLAQRVVDDADVSEALDVLSRPDVGVLQPIDKGQGVGRVQVLVGVNLPGLPEHEGNTRGVVVTLPEAASDET